MTKKFGIFLSALFCVFLGGMLAVSLLLPDESFSPLENRYLAKPPVLSLKTLANGDFMAGAEEYVSDHLVGRDFWVALKAWSERLSGKRENNGVYFADGDTLINRVDDPDMDKLDRDMTYVDALAGNVEVPVRFGLIPSAAAIWSDRLPDGAPTADEKGIIDALYSLTRAQSVDLYDALSAHADEALYYRTDHHWTSLGAYYGANAVFEALGLAPVAAEELTPVTVSKSFYGTIFSSSGVRWVEPDSIETYVPEAGVTVTSYFNSAPVAGELYAQQYLDKKDKYSYFLGGNQPLCVAESQADGPRVLVVRDSYADALTPFLTLRCSEVHLFDLRYNLTSLKDYVREHGIDEVLVLYSVSNFAADKNLSLLAR